MTHDDGQIEDPIDTEAVAEMLGMNVQEVRRFARESAMPAYKIPGRKRYYFFRSEILDWIRSHPVMPDD